ncbi:MORN repeat protein [Leptospira interrogans]|uniref:MORN repeat protein n=1 Tax=Leptospira interrogans TaxID=173 RepID=UPI000297E7DA|nr:MORN repeat protein [Leptospira interrogans]EKR25065.1 MORN repeat protein [Leptospira interrogans serovar Bataviae str. L1111]
MIQFFLRSKLSILVILITALLLGGSYFYFFKETCNGDCKNGFGSKIYWNGKKYVGQWKNGKENGYGVLVAKDQKILYSGKWQEGNQISKESDMPKKNNKFE